MNTIFKKRLCSWSQVRKIFLYRKLIRASIKIFRPVLKLKITNKKIMQYVSMVTIFTMVFGLSFWSTDFNSAYADSTSVGASKDSWIDQKSSKADSNHGDDDDNDLLVRSETDSKNKRLLVAFDLPDLSDNAVVDSATLILHTKNDPPTSRTYGVHRINEDWEELDVTWNNRPDAELSATSTTLTDGVVDDEDMSWDVTSDVQDFYDESLSNYGWMIQDETENNSPSKESKFRSREYNSDTERPELQIEYHLDLPDGSIAGHKFNDLNGNGVWDENELGLSGWTMILSNGNETVTDEDGYYTFNELEDDNYTVCEVMPESEDEWTQTWPTADEGVDCDGTYGHSVTITNGNSYEENNFGNIQYGSVIIIKETIPSDHEDQFTFTFTDHDNQQLSDGQSYTYENLIAGNYTVQEIVPDGWTLSNIDCVYDEESVGQETENGKVVSLDAGDDVVCTFTNTKLGSITILKASQPDGTFDFNLLGETDDGDVEDTKSITTEDGEGETIFDNLYPGEYDIRETLFDGWKEPTIECLLNGESEVDNTDFELPAGGNVTCTFNNTEYAVISGTKFEDSNANGIWDDGEDGLSDWNVTLTMVGGEEDDPETISTPTSEGGNYIFSNLDAGTYEICEELKDGWVQSMPYSGVSCGENEWGYEVTLSAGQTVSGQDFGNHRSGLISGSKFNDLDGNGLWDEGEPRLDGWTIYIDADNNGVFEGGETYTTTDEDGNYSFNNLTPGDYVIREVNQDGWLQKLPSDGNGYEITLTSGEVGGDNNFGNFKLATVTGFKWNDKNGDGVWQKENEENSGEPGLRDVIVALGRVNGKPTQEDGREVIPIEIIALSLTGVNGGFQIRDVGPGHYKLLEEKKNGWQATNPAPSIDSFFDITYIADGDPDFDLLRLRNPDFSNSTSFFDVFVELSGQDVNQSEATRADLTIIPSVPLEFGNHQLSVISEEDATEVSETSVMITWNTDREATSRVIYDAVSHSALGSGLCPFPLETLECYGYAFSTPESDLEPKVLEHGVVINGLTAGTTYYFRSVSHASPESVGSEGSFDTQSPSSDNSGGSSGGGGGGGAPGSVILDGPTPTPPSTDSTGSQQASSGSSASPTTTPTPFATPTPLFIAGATISGRSGVSESSMTTSDLEEKFLDESGQVVSSPAVIPEAPEEDRGVSENNNLFASLFGIFGVLNSASFWWLIIIVFVALMLFRISSSKKK